MASCCHSNAFYMYGNSCRADYEIRNNWLKSKCQNWPLFPSSLYVPNVKSALLLNIIIFWPTLQFIDYCNFLILFSIFFFFVLFFVFYFCWLKQICLYVLYQSINPAYIKNAILESSTHYMGQVDFLKCYFYQKFSIPKSYFWTCGLWGFIIQKDFYSYSHCSKSFSFQKVIWKKNCSFFWKFIILKDQYSKFFKETTIRNKNVKLFPRFLENRPLAKNLSEKLNLLE